MEFLPVNIRTVQNFSQKIPKAAEDHRRPLTEDTKTVVGRPCSFYKKPSQKVMQVVADRFFQHKANKNTAVLNLNLKS